MTGKPRRRRVRIENSQTAEEALGSPVESAIDRVARQAAETPPVQGVEIKLPLLQPMLALQPGAKIDLTIPLSGPEGPQLLFYDYAQRAWRGVVLPPETRWYVIQDSELPAPKPALWKPGMPS
jgi:hypothetical protein